MISKNKIYNSEIFEDIIQNKLKTNNKINILEIGAYDGSSSSWIIDNFKCRNESIKVSESQDNLNELVTKHFHKRYELFIEDDKVLYPEKIKFYNDKSICNLPSILNDKRHYDIIFINGSYLLQDIYEDIEMCWDLLASNGYLFIDEYKNKNSIDELFKSFTKKYEIISSNGSKIIIKKLS